MRRAAFFVICCCLFSCRGFFADIQKANNSGGVSEITIPALGTSTSIEKCSIYALLCNEHVDLSVDLLKRMLIDGYTRTEHADFKNAHKLHSDKGIVEQLTYIDTPVSKPVSISFKNASQLKKYFIRILICQNGVIKYSGTTPENAIGQSAGKYFVTDNLFSPSDRDNEIGMTLHPIKLITYYVSNSGKVEADACTFNEPTTLDKALKAIAALTESEKQGVSIVLLDDITTVTSQTDFNDALQKAESIEISSIDTSVTPCKLALPNNFTIPANAKLFFNNVSLTGIKNLTVQGNLSLNEITLTADITSSNGVLTLNSTTLTGKITSTNGTVSLVNGASVKTGATDGSGTIVGNNSVIAVNPNTQVEGTVTANGGVIQMGGNAKIGNKTSAIVLAANMQDATKPYGHIEITSELTTEAIELTGAGTTGGRLQLPVYVDNEIEVNYTPFESAPIITGNVSNLDFNSFDFNFLLSGSWKIENFKIIDVNKTEGVNTWLFKILAMTNDPSDIFMAPAPPGKTFAQNEPLKGGNLDGYYYRFSKESIFSVDPYDNKIYIKGWIGTKTSYKPSATNYYSGNVFTGMEASGSLSMNYTDEDYLYDIYANNSEIYFTYNDIYMKKVKKGTNPNEDDIFYILKFPSEAALSKCIFCVNDVYVYTLNENNGIVKYEIPQPLISKQGGYLVINTVSLKDSYSSIPLNTFTYHDITFHNGAIYILAGQVISSGTIYSRGAVIKVGVSGTNMQVVDTYGLSSTNTAETDEANCFYNPVRFLGVRDNDLIIADDGRTERGIQKNRVVFFDTSTNKIKAAYYTDAEFLGVY